MNIKSRNKLRTLFLYYCSFIDKDSHSSLKLQSFRRMLEDMQLPKNPNYDIIFHQNYHAVKSISFEDFLSKLPKIAQAIFGSSKEALQKLIEVHALPLYDCIIESTPFGKGVTQLSRNHFQEDDFGRLRRLKGVVESIYKWYLGEAGDRFLQLSRLAHEMELVPKHFSRSLSYQMYLFLVESQVENAFRVWFVPSPRQENFELFQLVAYLILAGAVSGEGLNAILKTIQLSAAYQTIVDIHKLPLVLSDSHLEFPKQEVLTFENILGDRYRQLKIKFNKMCCKTTNSLFMEAHAAKKIIRKIFPRTNQLQTFLGQLTRLDFQGFLQVISSAAQMYARSFDSAIDDFIINTCSVPQQQSTIHMDHYELELCNYILTTQRGYLMCIFRNYSTNFLSISDFYKLTKEMDLVPFSSRDDLTDIFYEYSKGERMNFQNFNSALLLIAMSDRSLTSSEKLLYMFEKMAASSKSRAICNNQSKQDPLHLLKLRFKGVYADLVSKLYAKKKKVGYDIFQ